MTPMDADAGMEARLRCLEAHLCADDRDAQVRRIETHMSWVLVGQRRVLKLKKPVRMSFLDFSTLEARERNARQEVLLNRRLAPKVYLGLLALQQEDGELRAVPEERLPAPGRTIDWVVVMQRLPSERMLDALIARGELRPSHIDALLGILVPFYRGAARAKVDEAGYVMRMREDLARSRDVLERPQLGLLRARALIERTDSAITRHEGLLRRRVAEARIIDGHGDLRPEHVALTDPPVVIDALEFDERLREVDPFDELCFLGLECAVAGDASVGPSLQAGLASALGDAPPAALLMLHTAARALLRARLSAAHLLEAEVRTPWKWLPQASRYLDHATAALERLERLVDS